jgi:hypothetical protein
MSGSSKNPDVMCMLTMLPQVDLNWRACNTMEIMYDRDNDMKMEVGCGSLAWEFILCSSYLECYSLPP